MGLIERKYEIAVCTICGSDNIFSTEHDSWCDDCREWMNAEVVVVVPEAASAGAVETLEWLTEALERAHAVLSWRNAHTEATEADRKALQEAARRIVGGQ